MLTRDKWQSFLSIFCRSETGQKVKELEEELALTKSELVQYQQLVLRAKKEAGELQISV
jgi:hypothetical protein